MPVGVSIDNFGASMIKYMPGVRKVLNNTTNARKIPKGEMMWTGSGLHFFLHMSRNPAIAAMADGGRFPIAGKQGYAEAKIGRKFTGGSVSVTDGILKNAASTENAAISITASELTGLMDGIRKHDNYFFTRDGTGIVTTLGATVSGSTISVDDARGMWDGKDFEIRDATTTTTIHIPSFTVSSVARAFNTSNEAVVTPSASVSSSGQADGDYVVWGSGDMSSYGRVFTGLDALIDDSTSGTFQGLTMSSYPRWTSPVLSNGGVPRALTPSLFRHMLAMIKQEGGTDPAQDMVVLSNIFQSISFEEMYEGDLRLRPDDDRFGVAATSFTSSLGNVSLVTDPDAPYGKIFFIDPAQLVYAELAALDWRKDGPGSPIFKRDDSAAKYTATCLESNELVVLERNKCGKIEDLSETKYTAY
jgi:hypothetical protein